MNVCKYCGEEIKNTNAPECDRCWEIQWYCIGNPELVSKILKDTQPSTIEYQEKISSLDTDQEIGNRE